MDFNYVRHETVNSHAQVARIGDPVALKELVERCPEGAKSRDNRGWEPIHEAAAAGNVDAISYLCVGAGVDINSQTWEGETPLFLACKNLPATKQAVYCLLKLRARVNLSTNENCTPLQYAAVKGELEVVRWLVRKGASVTQDNVWLETPLHCTLKRSSVDNGARLSVVKYLIKHGAKVKVVDENQLTPLMLASQKGLRDVCEVLLETDPDVLNMCAEDGATAVMLACQSGCVDVVDLLLDRGADLDHCAEDGTMALHLASIAKKNSATIVERILGLTDLNSLNLVYAANKVKCSCKSLNSTREVKQLSPFHLAMDWENFDSVGVLAGRLDPRRFHIPLDDCPVHNEFCRNFQEGGCKEFQYISSNPLAHLLSLPHLPDDINSLLEILAVNIDDTFSIPPILAFLTGNVRLDNDFFEDGNKLRDILSRLVDKGATLDVDDYFPLILLSHVSGLYGLLREGVVNPQYLADQDLLEKVRQLINQGFSRELLNTQFSVPFKSTSLLAFAHLLAETGVLDLSYFRRLHDTIWFQLTELQIPKVKIIEDLYNTFKTPKSLQQLTRSQIYNHIKGRPRESLRYLGLPNQIVDYLLFNDISIQNILKANKDTLELLQSAGTVL